MEQYFIGTVHHIQNTTWQRRRRDRGYYVGEESAANYTCSQDAMEIDDDPIVTSREALRMLDQLQIFARNNPDLLREVPHLTKRVEQITAVSWKQKNI